MKDRFPSLQAALADRYELERELGRGGMATVYLARDLKHPRNVAIKVLRPELAGVMTRGRFIREIRICSELTHPHILPLLDSGTVPSENGAASLPYYTMPYVEGESLQQRLAREKQLPLDDALEIARNVAAALAYAHGRGVVHRDIKPGNILLTGGQAIVADFGIARAVKEAVDPESVTSAGMVIGTPAYMSPEQAGGQAELDGRSDIYSLGCVLYEMLGGEPPFTGATPQAVIARHRMDPAPSLSTLRSTVPASVALAIRRSLEKSPADRYATAEEFGEALRPGPSGSWPTVKLGSVAAATRRRHGFLIGAVCVAAALLGWWAFGRRGTPMDSDKIVVFPLGQMPAEAMQAIDGPTMAWYLVSALDYADPLKSIPGDRLLDARQHLQAGQLSPKESRRITRDVGARWYIDGMLVRQGDSVTVTLVLNDAKGDSMVARATGARLSSEAPQAGLAALNQLLPRLLAPGQQMADLSALEDRKPTAVATWLQGEQAYRNFDFTAALGFYQRAVEQDTQLAVAAIRGAQAASWPGNSSEARALAAVAVQHVGLLPGRIAPFAHGLLAYLNGQTDSAVAWLGKAIQLSPGWTEAHMSLGEVYYHRLPLGVPSPESMAEHEFLAAAADPGFAPARYHLAEIAIRSGDTVRANRAVQEFSRVARADASTEDEAVLGWMLACITRGRESIDWQLAARTAPNVVLRAASNLAGGGVSPRCAEDAYRAVFVDSAAALGYKWGGFLGFQGLLAAEGRTAELKALVDSAVTTGLGQANHLYVLDALAGLDVALEAADVVRQDSVMGLETLPTFMMWLAGDWYAHTSDLNGLARALDALRAAGGTGGRPEAVWYAEALDARRLLARGDTLGGMDRLRHVLTAAPQLNLSWSVGRALEPDRLLYAELLLAKGRAAEAIAVASVFDLAEVATFVPFLPASLAVRRDAAELLGNTAEANVYAARLAALGRSRDHRRSTTEEAP